MTCSATAGDGLTDTAIGYTPATVLRSGQSAWAYSAAGGTLTITDPSRCTYATGLPSNRTR